MAALPKVDKIWMDGELMDAAAAQVHFLTPPRHFGHRRQNRARRGLGNLQAQGTGVVQRLERRPHVGGDHLARALAPAADEHGAVGGLERPDAVGKKLARDMGQGLAPFSVEAGAGNDAWVADGLDPTASRIEIPYELPRRTSYSLSAPSTAVAASAR